MYYNSILIYMSFIRRYLPAIRIPYAVRYTPPVCPRRLPQTLPNRWSDPKDTDREVTDREVTDREVTDREVTDIQRGTQSHSV